VLLVVHLNNTSAIFKAKKEVLEQKYKDIVLELLNLSKECPHLDLTYKYDGSSGNWDRSADIYYIDWKCQDCGKSWVTSQDDSWDLTTKVYPHAKQIK